VQHSHPGAASSTHLKGIFSSTRKGNVFFKKTVCGILMAVKHKYETDIGISLAASGVEGGRKGGGPMLASERRRPNRTKTLTSCTKNIYSTRAGFNHAKHLNLQDMGIALRHKSHVARTNR
jgi:hypothetical protein